MADQLDKDLLAVFAADRTVLPEQPFVNAVKGAVKAELLAVLDRAQQAHQRRLCAMLAAQVQVIGVSVAVLQPLLGGINQNVDSLLAQVNQPLPLAVAALCAAVVVWCFRQRLQRYGQW